MLAFDPVASPFCVSYLSMTTHIITDYANPTTDTATTNTASEATVTSTRSVETITCLDTAYSYVAPVPTIDRGSPHPDKRGQGEIEVPEAIPSDWTEAQTSDICSCLDLEEPTTHTTITETSTVTAWVVETTLADKNDIAYRRFNSPFDAYDYDSGFGTDYFKGKPVLSSGNGQT
ncbi:GLEYA domain protein [Fusarium subglutinans]|uniref:GLEYA domain protein n=1 Tax=Gibberella subglutinans TaxID=42677 RepID=A0A8H5V910_GIBSU|nr:GLEYA domain protein [Fusarium subglutinans]KAF5613623.1 GLEYA domain protein [Fusarium subglutinans]